MKFKYILFLPICILLIAVSRPQYFIEAKFGIIKSDKHFFIVGDDESRIYEYTIFDAKGKIVEKSRVERVLPTILYISDNIIAICFHGGTYANLCKYYNIDRNIFSDEFWNPFLVADGQIVYLDGIAQQLIVQDIFDTGVFYKEFPIDMIFTGPPESIELIDNGRRLMMTYMRLSDYEDETAVFDLTP